MINLQPFCGLPVKFNPEEEKFEYGEGVMFDAVNKVSLASLLPGLLNKSLRYPEYVYLEHKNIRNANSGAQDKGARDQQEARQVPRKSQNAKANPACDQADLDDYNFDLLMLPSGLMGVEFIRSHIYFAPAQEGNVRISEVIETYHGELTILLQKNMPKADSMDFETRVGEGLVVKLSPQEKFCIPDGYYYTFINMTSEPVVFSRFYEQHCICDYSLFQREKGLAYFAIKKNAKHEIVLNPRYREIPEIREVSNQDFLSQIPTSIPRTALYERVFGEG